MDLAPKDLSPQCAAAARKLAGTVLAQRQDSAVRHPAFGGWARLTATRADELAAGVPPFPRASLRYIAQALRSAATAQRGADLDEATLCFGTAMRFAKSLLLTLDRYAPESAPTVCAKCGEPYVASLARVPRQAPPRGAEPLPYDVVAPSGVAYVAEDHTPCAAA